MTDTSKSPANKKVSPGSHRKKHHRAKAQKNYWQRFWGGDFSLARAYWLHWILPSAIGRAIIKGMADDSIFITKHPLAFMSIASVVIGIYVIGGVGVLKSVNTQYPKKKSFWAITAAVLVILGFVVTAIEVGQAITAFINPVNTMSIQDIESQVNTLNDTLPIKLDNITTWTHVEYLAEKQQLSYDYVIAGFGNKEVSAISSNPDAFKRIITAKFKRNFCEGDLKQFMESGKVKSVVLTYQIGQKYIQSVVTSSMCESEGSEENLKQENQTQPALAPKNGYDSPNYDSPMAFKVSNIDLRPAMNITQIIYADGDLAPGTTKRFTAVLNNIHPSSRVLVILNSDGGSLVEGLALSKAIHEHGFSTSVGAMGSSAASLLPGECFSACIFAYLGGKFRYMMDASKFGVHQFYFTDQSFNSNEATAVSQILSGKAMEVINQAHVDTKFFNLITGTLPDTLLIIPHDVLQSYNVITGNILSQQWDVKTVNGRPYVKAAQLSDKGYNEIGFMCGSQGLIIALTSLEAENPESVRNSARVVGLVIDDTPYNLRNFSKSDLNVINANGQTYLSFSMKISSAQMQEILTADSIGAFILTDDKKGSLFMKDVSMDYGRKLLADISGNCMPVSNQPQMEAPGTTSQTIYWNN